MAVAMEMAETVCRSAKGPGSPGVQRVIGEGLLGAAVRHGVAELLPKARARLVALRAVPVHHAQTFNGLF